MRRGRGGLGTFLDRKIELSGRQLAVVSILMLSPLVVVAWLGGVSEFSPDSWSYFELSKSVFSDRFYAFNTYRSYLSESYSTSFPLGYPVLLAVSGKIFGAGPWLAVAVNLVVAGTSWGLILAICRKLKLPSLSALGLCATLVLFPGYLDEIYTGRAIPAAILMILLGVRASLDRAGFVAGLWIGCSALFRFDFLPDALLVIAAGSLLWPRQPGLVAARLLGLLAGLTPWIVYSWLHFGKLWISDNSWVALSAVPAFVLDYPARPVISAAADPLLWLRRVLGNSNEALWSFASNLWQVPALVGFAIILALDVGRIGPAWRKRLAIAAAASGFGVAPYLLTGYFDLRYFSFLYLAIAFVIAAAIAAPGGGDRRAPTNAILLASLFAALAVAGHYHVATARKALASGPNEARIAGFIRGLDACQRRNGNLTYIFAGKQGMGLVFRYGAVTGHRAAAIPSNFDRMSDGDRKRFFQRLAPYRIVRKLPGDIGCGSA